MMPEAHLIARALFLTLQHDAVLGALLFVVLSSVMIRVSVRETPLDELMRYVVPARSIWPTYYIVAARNAEALAGTDGGAIYISPRIPLHDLKSGRLVATVPGTRHSVLLAQIMVENKLERRRWFIKLQM